MSRFMVHNQADGCRFEQSGGDTILRAAQRAGIGLMYECNSGGCGSCKFELIDGAVDCLWPEAPGLTERDRRRGRQLACQCRATAALTIKAPTADEYLPRIRPCRRRAVLRSCRDITHDMREFVFVADGPADFLPGQYAMLDLPGLAASRAYSLSNTANAAGEWHFQVRRVANGKATGILFDQLNVGAEIALDGPYGIAWLRPDSPRDIVCVAGGSGLAPMVSIARAAAEGGLLATRSLSFFYGARTPRDVCGEDLLRVLPGTAGRIRYVPVVSLPGEGDASTWMGETGWVHDAVARALPGPLSKFEFYFAGPPPMAQAMQEMLMIGHQVPFQQIHFDRFF